MEFRCLISKLSVCVVELPQPTSEIWQRTCSYWAQLKDKPNLSVNTRIWKALTVWMTDSIADLITATPASFFITSIEFSRSLKQTLCFKATQWTTPTVFSNLFSNHIATHSTTSVMSANWFPSFTVCAKYSKIKTRSISALKMMEPKLMMFYFQNGLWKIHKSSFKSWEKH